MKKITLAQIARIQADTKNLVAIGALRLGNFFPMYMAGAGVVESDVLSFIDLSLFVKGTSFHKITVVILWGYVYDVKL